jgi:hypothetical protein
MTTAPNPETAAFEVRERVKRNLAAVRQRIRDAAGRVKRSAGEVRLVAVTKYAAMEECQALYDAGQRLFGESRLPDCLEKIEAMPRKIEWHMIGHVQSKKAKHLPEHFALTHSLDSVSLLEKIADRVERVEAPPVRGLLEFNVAGESQKHGFALDDWREALEASVRLAPRVQIAGLMCMAPHAGSAESSRQVFARLRELRDQMQAEAGDDLDLGELSMGMSGDFEVAIEEGATLVRVGSALFEKGD